MGEHRLQEGWVVVPQVQAMTETVYGVRTHYVHSTQGGRPWQTFWGSA